ncbi:MAG: methyltransferase [Spirochaetaceae bacterium]|nr:methyltransferase [Spirochaetaceae bacterium]
MKYTFYATFAPGLAEAVKEVVLSRLDDARFIKLLDGAVIFETSRTYDRLGFFCFNNIFAVIDIRERRGGLAALETHLGLVHTTGEAGREIITKNSKNIRSFRIVTSLENRPAAVEGAIRSGAERYIARCSGLALDRANRGAEFWFLYRSEGFSVFMKRLTRRASWEKSLRPGELPPPLAWMLCRLANIGPGDTVLDPFSGSGAIPFQALKHFPPASVIAADISAEAIRRTRKKLAAAAPARRVILCKDVAELAAALGEKSVTKIVSDPPWGFFAETALPLEQFYRNMTAVFSRILADEGAAVLLSARKPELEQAAETAGFEITRRFSILLSGKKAGIFLLEKRGGRALS